MVSVMNVLVSTMHAHNNDVIVNMNSNHVFHVCMYVCIDVLNFLCT